MKRKRITQCGFTLLEVLVALTIAAIALGAIIKVTAESANNIAYLRERTLAGWVAMNQINQLLLSQEWPAADKTRSGKIEMADRQWFWELKVSETSDKDLRRLEVLVSDRDNAPPLATLIAFKGKPSVGNTLQGDSPSGGSSSFDLKPNAGGNSPNPKPSSSGIGTDQ